MRLQLLGIDLHNQLEETSHQTLSVIPKYERDASRLFASFHVLC